MLWWLIPLLILVLLSPLTWLLPDRNLQARMNVRLEARRLGLAMQVAPCQWPHWMAVEPPDPCPQYRLPRLGSGQKQLDWWQISEGVWVNQWRETQSLDDFWPEQQPLPRDLYRLEVTPQCVTAYWGERGGSPALAQVAQVMKVLQRY